MAKKGIVLILFLSAGVLYSRAEDDWRDITSYLTHGFRYIPAKVNRITDYGQDLIGCELKQGVTYTYKIAAVTTFDGERETQPASGTPRKIVVLVRGGEFPYVVKWSYWSELAPRLQADGCEIWDVSDGLDVRESIESNASRLHAYLDDRLEHMDSQATLPVRLNFITHGSGGQTLRACLAHENGSFEVDRVIMLAPTLCGSWIADWALATKQNAWYGSADRVSTYDLCVARSLAFNAVHPLLPRVGAQTRYFTIAGTGGQDQSLLARVVEESVRNNHPHPLQITPDELINDGLVTHQSAWGEVGRAEANVSENPNAEWFFDVTGFNKQFSVTNDFFGMLTDGDVYVNYIWPLLCENFPTTVPQLPLKSSQIQMVPETLSESVEESVIPVGTFPGTLSSGGSKSLVAVISSTPLAEFWVVAPLDGLTFTLRKPDGTEITAGTPGGNVMQRTNEYSGSVCYSVSNPEAGQWTMTVTCGDVGTNTIGYTALVWERSSLTFAVSCNTAFVRTNDQLTIVGTLNKAGTGVAGATVGGSVYSPDGSTNAVTLSDDGLHGDGGAGDGVYGVQFGATQQVGVYGINLKASGTETTGEAFEREGLGQVTFTAFSPIAELTDVYADYGIDLAPTNGLIDDFIIEVGVRVKEGGTFTVSGVLTGTNGVGITSAMTEVTATEAGIQTVLLRFDAPAIYDSGALGGFDLTDLSLFGTGNNCALLDARAHAYATAGYDYFQFERADKDGDGLSDLSEEKIGTDPELVDSDFDKMPDKWESDNRLDPLVDDTALDADQDGMSNFEELLAGTNPQDNTSNLSIIDMTGRIESEDDGYLSIAFRSVPQRKYAVLRAESLSGPWVQVGEPFVALSAESRVSFPKVPTQRCAFYRILLATDAATP